MMKYFNYATYKDNETQGYEYLTDIGDYDIYVRVENQVPTFTDYKIIYHENIVGWEYGRVKSTSLYSKQDIDELKHAIKGYENEIEEPINEDEPEVLTDRDYWRDMIEELLQIN